MQICQNPTKQQEVYANFLFEVEQTVKNKMCAWSEKFFWWGFCCLYSERRVERVESDVQE